MTVTPKPRRGAVWRMPLADRKPQSEMIHSPAPQPKPCPVCGVTLLARWTKPSHPEPDHFECLNCGTVVKYSEPRTPPPKTTDEEGMTRGRPTPKIDD